MPNKPTSEETFERYLYNKLVTKFTVVNEAKEIIQDILHYHNKILSEIEEKIEPDLLEVAINAENLMWKKRINKERHNFRQILSSYKLKE